LDVLVLEMQQKGVEGSHEPKSDGEVLSQTLKALLMWEVLHLKAGNNSPDKSV